MEYFVSYKNSFIAHRSPTTPSLLFELLPLFHSSLTPFLRYNLPDRLPSYWTNPQYEDYEWEHTSDIGTTNMDGSAFVRVHVNPPHLFATSFLIRVTVRSAVTVYVDGTILFSKGISLPNADRHYQPIITMPIEPCTYVHEVPLRTLKEEMVIAVKLDAPTEEGYAGVFSMEVIMNTARDQQVTSVDTEIDASPSIVLVCEGRNREVIVCHCSSFIPFITVIELS